MGSLMKIGALTLTVALTLIGAARIEPQGQSTFGEILGPGDLNNIIATETTRYVDEFESMTALRAKVSPTFTPDISKRVSPIQAQAGATAVTAETALRTRFRYFLSNMTAYLLGTKQDLAFTPDNTAKYLTAAGKAGHCGEYPCESGCAQGKPCDERCNTCVKKGGGVLVR